MQEQTAVTNTLQLTFFLVTLATLASFIATLALTTFLVHHLQSPINFLYIWETTYPGGVMFFNQLKRLYDSFERI